MQSHLPEVSKLTLMVPVAILLLGAAPTQAQEPVIPVRDFGQSVIGAFEGWYQNPDGSFTLLAGYFNRNMKEVLDIPVGPNNRVEPGELDRGQPTRFLPRRQWGVFTITVPPDFGDQKLTWTLTANGETSVIPLSLNPQWRVEPFKNAAMGNTPPVVRFEEGGTLFQGPPRDITAYFRTNGSDPLPLTVLVTDDMYRRPGRRRTERPPLSLFWFVIRGPGQVTFEDAEPEVPETGGEVTTTATFDTPGEYVLGVQAFDTTGRGGGGSQCCWTTAHVQVTVSPGTGSP